jgi:hypothetical protein
VRSLVRLLRASWPLQSALARLPGRTHDAPGEAALAVSLTRAEWMSLGAALDGLEPYPLRIEAGRVAATGGWHQAVFAVGHHEPTLFAAIAVGEIRAAKIARATGQPCGCAGAVRPDVTAVAHEWWVPAGEDPHRWTRLKGRPADEEPGVPVTVYRLSPERLASAFEALGGGTL